MNKSFPQSNCKRYSNYGPRDEISLFNSLPNDKILDRSNLKQSADDKFKFDENRRKFSKRTENIVDK